MVNDRISTEAEDAAQTKELAKDIGKDMKKEREDFFEMVDMFQDILSKRQARIKENKKLKNIYENGKC